MNDRVESYESAKIVVPIILELMKEKIGSVCDIGCGNGCWLRAFMKHGIVDVLGVDCRMPEILRIPKEQFIQADLSNPFRDSRVYDLVISLELGEHLRPSAAETFIDTLTGLGPVILFSAAIKYQGGNKHLNEQMPEYWAGLFAKRGFKVSDPIRRRIWNDQRVCWWYRQNILIFFKEPGRFPEADPSNLSLVHPELFEPAGRLMQKMGKIGPKWLRNIGKRFL